MSIRPFSAAAIVAAAAVVATHGAAQPKPEPVEPIAYYPPASGLIVRGISAQDAKPAADKAPKLTDLLGKRVTLDKPFEGKFKDAVEFIADKYELPIVLDPLLREFPAAAAQCDGLDDKPVKLPKMMNVRVETLLRLTCEQADAMFLVYPDYIRIVPTIFALYETGVATGGTDPNDDQPSFLPADQLLKSRPLTRRAIVNLSFKDAPLTEILDEIASRSGANVALAPLVNEKAHTKLTIRFANAPVDAAVRTICEMADLAMIEDANVLVVTTRERAAARMKMAADKKRAELVALQAQSFPPNVVGGFGGLGGFGGEGASPDLGSEIAKLKEQNEQLRKLLDEVMKNLKK